MTARLKVGIHLGGVGAAVLFVGCIGYAAYTHSWPWWLVGGAWVSFLVGLGSEK